MNEARHHLALLASLALPPILLGLRGFVRHAEVNIFCFCVSQVTMETLPAPVPIDRLIPRFVLDRIFCGYYVFQFISTPLLDMQGTLPTWLYPSWVSQKFVSLMC